ncbi:MAG: bifunctional shikimate kinase/3-dehydroquinate synthase [Solirubrobacteraceae bacterium]|nr:bifunctional shikimate kinase/3-dehydroquinate synthase [Solirubrobacteraceae bacterium]
MGGALVFVGFMGAGKSTAARSASDALGKPLVDIDAEIELRTGRTIPEIFEADGEAAFRELEERTILEVLDGAEPGMPVALGGGALGSARVREALKAHTVCWLEIDEATAWRRAKRSDRPLARDKDAFTRLYFERQATYEAAADVFLPQGGRSFMTRIAARLLEAGAGRRLAFGRAGEAVYPVWFGERVWPVTDDRDVVITDRNVAEHHGARWEKLRQLQMEPGEAHKTLATAERLWTELAEMGATRGSRIIAVGGGVAGDVAGFVAATYQRGIPVVQVPTTLVSQIDSALGGKTGVDLPAAKNYVGAYHQPEGVHVLPSMLKTLPAAERAAGYAEVVKTGLIAGGTLWDQIKRGAVDEPDVVLGCARVKLDVVARDEKDGGPRQMLNLGHTVGHAIETVTHYSRYRHGEAVGLGLLAILRLSGQDALRAEVRELLAEMDLPVTMDPSIDVDAVVAATRSDKKRIGANVPYVVLDAPGQLRWGQEIGDAEVRAAVEELR